MGYQFFYAGPRMKRAQELKRAQQERLEASQPTDETADYDSVRIAEPVEEAPPAETEVTSSELPRASASDAKFIRVATPHYEVTLSTLGGEVVSVRLFEWETDGLPVQLVRDDQTVNRGLLQVTLAGEDEELSLGDVLFEAYSDNSVDALLGGTTINVENGERKITFQTEGAGQIQRSYTFSADSYIVRSGVQFASTSYPFARDIVWGFGPGLRATEKNAKDDYDAMRGSIRLGDEFYRKKRGDFQEDFSGTVQWAALQMKYFTAIIIPEEIKGGTAQITSVKADNFITASIAIPAGESRGRVDQVVDVYFGPLDFSRLKTIGRGLEKNVDIGFNNFKIFKPVSIGILWSIVWLHKVIPNYGLVIIVISVLTKILFYRLTHKSFKSMSDMQALQPKLAALKEKYKDDRQKQSSETMRIYKEAGVNPLGGCLPMVFQMPVFIALFSVLRSTIEIRQAPFVGWINDLSQQDVLFSLPFSLPVIGSAVSVLPVLMGGSMLLQSKIGGSIAGPGSSTTQPKAFTYMLPIVFTFLFYKMPSGLVLYWLVNTVLSVAQQYYINKGAHKDKSTTDTEPEKPAKLAKPSVTEPPAKPARKTSGKGKKRKHRSKKG